MKPSLVATSIAVLSSGLVAAVACGGATDTEFFAPIESSRSGTDPTPPDDGTSGSTEPSDTGTSSSSSSGSTTSSSSSSSSSSSGGVDSGVPTNPGVYCGETSGGTDRYCTPSTQVCCMNRPGWGSEEPTFACETKGVVNCVTSTTIACDDRRDCPTSQLCCGLLDNSGYTNISCQAQCKNQPGRQAVQFCDPATANECPSGASCEESQRLPGFYVCKN